MNLGYKMSIPGMLSLKNFSLPDLYLRGWLQLRRPSGVNTPEPNQRLASSQQKSKPEGLFCLASSICEEFYLPIKK